MARRSDRSAPEAAEVETARPVPHSVMLAGSGTGCTTLKVTVLGPMMPPPGSPGTLRVKVDRDRMINNRKIHPKGNYVGTARDIDVLLDKKTERRLFQPSGQSNVARRIPDCRPARTALKATNARTSDSIWIGCPARMAPGWVGKSTLTSPSGSSLWYPKRLDSSDTNRVGVRSAGQQHADGTSDKKEFAAPELATAWRSS